jgi:hypothetical protein
MNEQLKCSANVREEQGTEVAAYAAEYTPLSSGEEANQKGRKGNLLKTRLFRSAGKGDGPAK